MKIIYFHQQEAFDAIPNFEGMSEDTAVAVANSNENCIVYDDLKEFGKAFNDGDFDANSGFVFIVGSPEPAFSDKEKELLREALICKIRQDSRAAKQITISQAISLIEAEKHELSELLKRI